MLVFFMILTFLGHGQLSHVSLFHVFDFSRQWIAVTSKSLSCFLLFKALDSCQMAFSFMILTFQGSGQLSKTRRQCVLSFCTQETLCILMTSPCLLCLPQFLWPSKNFFFFVLSLNLFRHFVPRPLKARVAIYLRIFLHVSKQAVPHCEKDTKKETRKMAPKQHRA